MKKHVYYVTLRNGITRGCRTFAVRAEDGRDAMRAAFRSLWEEIDAGVVKGRYGDFYVETVATESGMRINLLCA